MKYLFINSVAGRGSTGRIVAEKARELMGEGHLCTIAYGRDKVNCDDIPTIRIGTPWDYRLHGIQTRLFDNHGFGSEAATKKFLKWVRQYDPDVIWLHNVHGYYIHVGLLFEYLRFSGKKIFWTLHDCWSFTGHCSHFDFIGCEKWKTGCSDCPQKKEYPASVLMDNSQENYASKKYYFSGIPDLTIVVPSHWLAGKVRDSFLGAYPVEVVHNTINTGIFHPVASDFREKHGLQGKKMILGVASAWSDRKGLAHFVSIARHLDVSARLVLVGLSQAQISTMPDSVLCIPRTNSPQELAEIYSAADYFVNLTLEDNYPTVNLEARACGVPVISYETGGCPETLGEGDYLVPKGDWQAVLDIITKSGNDKKNP